MQFSVSAGPISGGISGGLEWAKSEGNSTSSMQQEINRAMAMVQPVIPATAVSAFEKTMIMGLLQNKVYQSDACSNLKKVVKGLAGHVLLG